MSKIEELLKNEKVEWKKLGDVCEIKTGQSISKNFVSNNLGEFPVINSGKEPLGYVNIWNTENDPIGITTRGAGVGSITYQEGKYFRGNLNYSVTIKNIKEIEQRFLYHVLINMKKEIHQLCTFNGIPALNSSELKKLQIPIPSIKVQEKIVEVLDKFTNYVAELQARTKQYEYYRDMLLSEECLNKLSNTQETLGEGNRLKITTLGEICDVRDGTHDSPKKQVQGKYLITSKNIKSGTVNFDNAYYISEYDYNNINKRSKVDIDDLLFTMIGTIGEVAHVREQPDYAIKNVGLIKNNNSILSRYLFYYLKSTYTKCYIEQNKSKGSQVFISLGNLRMLKLPVPSLNVQEHIVSILDKFYTLLHQSSDGLQKEIELRQKQYEYYREKLLDFKK